ncbi:MAG: phosphotransferase [Deltaproteobacteria bacterium]|nr:phosphotransferase [Deltaproteobacteria bacterium]
MSIAFNPAPDLIRWATSFFHQQGLLEKDHSFQKLAGDGSDRIFWRVRPESGTKSVIVMQNSPVNAFSRKENNAYLMIGRHLHDKALPVPEIYRYDLDRGWFILEDLGDRSLQETIDSPRIPLYREVLEILIRMQIEGSQGFDTRWTCQTTIYDHTVMRQYECHYFRDAFLSGYMGMNADRPGLDAAFDRLIGCAGSAENRFFLHRDFQSRNIMIRDGKAGIIDWQGGRLGPLAYDVASLLIDPYTALTPDEKTQLYNHYQGLLRDVRPRHADNFEKYFPYLAILRNLQILGAFSFLSRVKGKPFFEPFIAPSLQSLHDLLDELRDPALGALLDLFQQSEIQKLYSP